MSDLNIIPEDEEDSDYPVDEDNTGVVVPLSLAPEILAPMGQEP